MLLGLGPYADPVPNPYCGQCINTCNTPVSLCHVAPEPRCSTICSIDGKPLRDCAEIKFCNSSLIHLSFDECDESICAELDLCGLIRKDIVRGVSGVKVVKKNDAFDNCYYELSNALKLSLNGVQYTPGYNEDPNWLNLCLTSSDNSIDISAIESDSCNGGYALDLRSSATGLGTSIIFKDLAALADFGCEISNPGGPITIVMDGFDVQCVSNSEVRLKRKFGSLGSLNSVKNNGGNIDLISTDKSIQITPNDSANTIDLALKMRSTDSSKLSISRDSDGTFVLDPSGGTVNTAWQSFTPDVSASTTNPAFGAGTGASAKGQYKINPDNQNHTMYEITFGNSFGVGSYSLSLPVPSSPDALTAVGTFVLFEASGSTKDLGWAEIAPNDTKVILYMADGTRVSNTAPITIAQGDKFIVNIVYRSN